MSTHTHTCPDCGKEWVCLKTRCSHDALCSECTEKEYRALEKRLRGSSNVGIGRRLKGHFKGKKSNPALDKILWFLSAWFFIGIYVSLLNISTWLGLIAPLLIAPGWFLFYLLPDRIGGIILSGSVAPTTAAFGGIFGYWFGMIAHQFLSLSLSVLELVVVIFSWGQYTLAPSVMPRSVFNGEGFPDNVALLGAVIGACVGAYMPFHLQKEEEKKERKSED